MTTILLKIKVALKVEIAPFTYMYLHADIIYLGIRFHIFLLYQNQETLQYIFCISFIHYLDWLAVPSHSSVTNSP